MSIFRNIVISSTLALSVWATPLTAHSATIDFVALAVSNEGAYSGGTYGAVTLTANAIGNIYSTPYLDDLSGGKPAGLGVCSFQYAACSGRSDDNLGRVDKEDSQISFALIQGSFGGSCHDPRFVERQGVGLS